MISHMSYAIVILKVESRIDDGEMEKIIAMMAIR